MQYWDLKILLPILFVSCTISMVFLCRKEKLQKISYMWLAQIILFWVVAGLIGNELKNHINNLSSTTFILASIFSTSLFLIILKPLATFTTSLIKNRKIWIQASSGLMLILAIMVLTLKLPLWELIIVSLIFSLCLASSTLFYLFLNEQSFYRIYVMPSVWITFVFITFSTTFGIYLSNLNIVVWENATSSKMSLMVIMILLAIGSIALSIFIKENKNMVQVFDQEILEALPKKNNSVFCLIYLLGLLLTVTSAISNSLFMKMYLTLNLSDLNFENDVIKTWLRINDFAYLIPSIFASVISYKLLRKIFEQKYLIFINMFVLFAAYTSMAFVQNPFVFIILNLIAGICFNQIIYSLFSVCLFWNYRAKKNPVTGYYGSAMFLAYFSVEAIQNTLSCLKIGLFKEFSNIDELLVFKNNSSDISIIVESFDNITTLIMSISCVVVLASILIFYFMSHKIFADYTNYKFATQNLKVLIKKRVISKTKAKFNVESIEEKGNDLDE